jgi:probable addiction module antidote protein
MTPYEAAKAQLENRRAAEMAEYLDDRLHMIHYDETTFARSLLLVSELHGIGYVARECGVSEEAMRRQLSGTRPLYFDSVLGVMHALGIRLRVEPIQRGSP